MSNAKVRGTAAFGKFKLCESAADVTNAAVLTDASGETPIFLRFSTVLGSRGSADTVRDVRGFAVKFYTEEDNWDVVGNNIPVFIQDAIKFPNVVHARKPEPHNEVPQAQPAHNNFCDFQFLHTEATHMFMWTQSDPPSQSRTDFEFDILDATKIWPEELVPIRYIGELELNRNVDEFFTQTEQVAFCTSHVVPGIGFSDDPLLQGRNFSYFDTQLSRLGINWQELPINRPVCPVMNQNRDGAMRHGIHKGTVNYWPNRYGGCFPAKPSEGGYVEFPEKLAGIKTRLRSKKFQEHFNQTQLFFNSLSEPEKAHIAAALSFELDHCDDPVVYERMCERLAEIDLKLAQRVAENLGGSIPQETKLPGHGKKTKNLSQLDFLPKRPTIASCRVATIIADGFDLVGYAGIKAALTAAQAFPFTIGSHRSPIFPAGKDRKSGEGVKSDHHLEGMRSTMFDSIFIPGGAESAFGHLKAIGAVGEAAALVKNTVDLPEITVSESAETQESYGVVTAAKITPKSFKGVFKMANGTKDFVDAYFYSISQHRNWDRELSGLGMQVAYQACDDDFPFFSLGD
ncbi:putative catalase 1 protein [Neofusicoccum parvum UCRNP2]|uniref:catalase n=1 Tax=Botryosphaeria parva (strain UCR-NP2) TaxID=1287680 RepID=R1G962_BOTPV|nr:putative catalase 1 protein [Neofusicoccum parvum UCRNP2]